MAWFDESIRERQAALDREVARATRHLRRRDPVIDAVVKRHGRCTVDATRNYFQLMVGTVITQQLSTKAARSIYGRLIAMLGSQPQPKHILAVSEADLRSVGLSRSKAQYLKNLAEAFTTSRMGPRTFARLSDDEAIARLTAIKGIGEWSAHMFLMFGLARMDVFPVGDLGLRNAMARAYG
ncbi:MAG TPA: DNA-3-methyladenine glycosylase 2 family protein, partial [Chromatiales bacterium]|nr:DNA-3-methyladenine glycosylase 2 family protein [Chromatiales bacterium]